MVGIMRTALALGCLAALAFAPALAAPKAGAKTPTATAEVAKGKTLASKYRCNSCHGADLAGKKGFSPSLHASGALKEYDAKTWARVLDTGVTNDGGKLKPPMPVYHMKAADSAALYAYFKTLK